MGGLQKTRVKVFYYSRTGNTKKVAEAIADELNGEAKDVVKSGTGGYTMKDCDLLFIGSGNYFFGPAREIIKFIGSMEPQEGKFAAVFGTYGAERGHLAKIRKELEKKGLKVLGEWGCPGQEYALVNMGRPNAADIAEARAFAKKTLKKIEVL